MRALRIIERSTIGVAAGLAGVLLLLTAALADPSDPERVEERLPAKAQPHEAPAPTRVPAPSVGDLSGFPRFTLNAVRVEGMTIFESDRVDGCFINLIGKVVAGAELSRLAQCITQIYRDEGYFLSRAVIPPQEIEGGVMNVRVYEGYIDSVTASGMSDADANAQFAVALRERPATLQTFERALLLLADRPGYRVAASQLAPDPNDPARFTYALKVTRMPLSYRLFADNRGTEAQGPEQVYASVAWNSVFGEADRMTGSLFTVPTSTRELLYADFNYFSGWCAGAFWTELGASFTRSEDGAVAKSLAMRTDTERFYVRLNAPLLRSRAESLWVNLSFDAREVEEAAVLDTDESTRVARANLTWVNTDASGRNDLTLEFSRGLDVLGASENGDPRLTRIDGRPQFTKLRLDASRLQKFSPQWDLLVTAAAQLADGALVSSEEFGAGGSRFGRAYDYSELTGDHGAAAAIELRYTMRDLFNALSSAQLYGFADAAWVWNTNPTAPDHADLSSAGLGARLTPFQAVSASVEVAKPLSRDVAMQGDRDVRVFISFSAAW